MSETYIFFQIRDAEPEKLTALLDLAKEGHFGGKVIKQKESQIP